MMIVIGGVIGIGLFFGFGSVIWVVGLVIILIYLIVGIFCFFMMWVFGELFLVDLFKYFFIDLVKEYLGDWMEFIVGWMYWFCWLLLVMVDLMVIGIYFKYWFFNLL